ncbi:MAG TPA: hypothetical protein VIK90_00135 [Limnochordales bacterium]
MSLATLIIAVMWLVLIALLVWAVVAGRRWAAAGPYKLQARLVEVRPRPAAAAARPAPAAAAPAARPAQAAAGTASSGAPQAGPAGPPPTA